MTEKRFGMIKSEISGLYVPIDNNKEFVFEGVEKASTLLKLIELLNKQHEQIQKYKRYFDIPVKDDGSSMNIRELLEENEQLKKLFYEMLIQTNVEIDPKKPTRYSATLIFDAEQYLTVKKIKNDFKR